MRDRARDFPPDLTPERTREFLRRRCFVARQRNSQGRPLQTLGTEAHRPPHSAASATGCGWLDSPRGLRMVYLVPALDSRRPDPLHSVQRMWARSPDAPHGWWHRIAWHRHEGPDEELVALCGEAVIAAPAEQSTALHPPGSACGECMNADEPRGLRRRSTTSYGRPHRREFRPRTPISRPAGRA